VAHSTAPDPDGTGAPAERRWGGPPLALAAILGLAAALRLVGIRHGLPYAGLTDPGEGTVVRRGWAMAHGGGFDPHRFGVPSGFLDLLGAVEAPFSHPSLLAARLLVVGLAVGAVAATWWLGSIYGLVSAAVAAAIVAVETAAVAHAHAAATATVPATLFVALALALAVRGRLLWAALAAGIATSVVYAGILLLVPLAILAGRRPRAYALGGAAYAVGFVAASPFVVAHPGAAVRGIWHALRGVRRSGFAAQHDHWAGIAYGGHLWRGFGPILVVAVLGLVVALVQRRSRADILLPAYALAAFAALCLTTAHPAALTLPLVPALAALAARVRYLASVTLLLLVVPLTWDVRADVQLTRTDTRAAALHWIDAHVPAGPQIAEDPFIPTVGRLDVLRLGIPRAGEPGRRRSLARLRAAGIDYVLVTGAVADRVQAARSRYPAEARFYAALARREPVVRFDGAKPRSGPWVALYRL
jgi:hypothetical protein